MCQHVASDELSCSNWFLFHVGFNYGFVYTESPLYANLYMTEGKNQLNYFNKILEQLDVNDLKQKIIETSFWLVKLWKFDLY